MICGPTGSGKTAIAIALAGNYPVEIVSADSRQVIKYLNIGTAKPTSEERKRVRFHLIDIVEPGERYSAYRFASEAEKVIGEILDRQSIPLVVGGTGLYLLALSEGVVEIDENDMQLRERLEQEMKESGPDAMYRKLEGIDPLEAARLHPNNQVRVIRALEIGERSGETATARRREHRFADRPFTTLHLAIDPGRDALDERIDSRCRQMIESGLLQEVRALRERGYGLELRSMQTIGYRHLGPVADGRDTLANAQAAMQRDTRRFARRQRTWLRRVPEAVWLKPDDRDQIFKLVDAMLRARR